MNYFKDYLEYIKDNKEGYWFKRKLYGWGWTPAKWQGWFTIFIFIVLIFLSGLSLGLNKEPNTNDLILFFGKLLFFIALLIYICYKKGEKPKWQWGSVKDSENKIE